MADYTIKRLDEVDDVLGDYPGEMRMMTAALEAEQVAFTFRRMPQHTGGKGSYGHRHKTQEEVYFVASGKLQFKLGDDVLDLEQGSVVRVPPETWRSVWNDEPEDAELIIVSKRVEGGSAEDAEYLQDFWPEWRKPEFASANSGRARSLKASASRPPPTRFARGAYPGGQDNTSATGRRHCSWNAGPRGPAPFRIGSLSGEVHVAVLAPGACERHPARPRGGHRDEPWTKDATTPRVVDRPRAVGLDHRDQRRLDRARIEAVRPRREEVRMRTESDVDERPVPASLDLRPRTSCACAMPREAEDERLSLRDRG